MPIELAMSKGVKYQCFLVQNKAKLKVKKQIAISDCCYSVVIRNIKMTEIRNES